MQKSKTGDPFTEIARERVDKPLFKRKTVLKPPILPKFLKVFRGLFTKSPLNGVWGKAPNGFFEKTGDLF